MSQAAEAHSQGVPRPAIMGAGLLVAFTFVAVLTGRAFGIGETRMPAEAPVQVLHLAFADQDDGGVLVIDAASGELLRRVLPGTDGFLRGAMRGFARERIRDGIGREQPFTLTRWRDGTLSLEDEATHRRIDLDAFGQTQAQDFAQLFAVKEGAK